MTDLPTKSRAPVRFAGLMLAATLGLAVAGCSMFGASGGGAALSPGLSARMDVAGAQLDKAQALGLINSYRSTRGAGALAGDAGLDAQAQELAAQYAASGNAPRPPGGVLAIRLSAGYATFAETFSGWRNSPEDAQILATPAGKAGLAVAFNGSSSYGVYWVLILGN